MKASQLVEIFQYMLDKNEFLEENNQPKIVFENIKNRCIFIKREVDILFKLRR
ncbi:MAG: hypothetical protein ACRDDK_00215 [Cetobacterium sp.]